MDEAKVIQVIETTILRRGSGEGPRSPVRIITQYWSLDGKLLAEVDPCAEVVPVEAATYERSSWEEVERRQAEQRIAEYNELAEARERKYRREEYDLAIRSAEKAVADVFVRHHGQVNGALGASAAKECLEAVQSCALSVPPSSKGEDHG